MLAFPSRNSPRALATPLTLLIKALCPHAPETFGPRTPAVRAPGRRPAAAHLRIQFWQSPNDLARAVRPRPGIRGPPWGLCNSPRRFTELGRLHGALPRTNAPCGVCRGLPAKPPLVFLEQQGEPREGPRKCPLPQNFARKRPNRPASEDRHPRGEHPGGVTQLPQPSASSSGPGGLTALFSRPPSSSYEEERSNQYLTRRCKAFIPCLIPTSKQHGLSARFRRVGREGMRVGRAAVDVQGSKSRFIPD